MLLRCACGTHRALFSVSGLILSRVVGTCGSDSRGDDRQLVPHFRRGKLSCGEAATSARLE